MKEHNISTRTSAAVLVFSLLLGACSGNRPIVDYDPEASFAAYRSYAFISEHPMVRAPDSPPGSPLLEARLMRVTDEVLQSRGYRKLDDPEAADFTIAFTVGAREKINVSSYPEPYRPYYGGWGWGASYYRGYGAVGVGMSTSTSVDQYTEGTLAVDVFDVAAHKPVWHGVATKRITDKMRRNPDEAVNEVLGEILSEFPPGL
jgi:hypothetical protein